MKRARGTTAVLMSGNWNWDIKPFWQDIIKALEPKIKVLLVASFGDAVSWSSDLERVLLGRHLSAVHTSR